MMTKQEKDRRTLEIITHIRKCFKEYEYNVELPQEHLGDCARLISDLCAMNKKRIRSQVDLEGLIKIMFSGYKLDRKFTVSNITKNYIMSQIPEAWQN